MKTKYTRSAKKYLLVVVLWTIGVNGTLFAAANSLDNRILSVFLVPNVGEPLRIGQIQFNKNADGYTYQLDLEKTAFEEYFLSMRPFKCLQGPIQQLCHLPYLYAKGTHINEMDILDLEYDFLFIHRRANDYGIDPWNGIYYKLTQTENGFEGVLQELDLNILAAPPAKGVTRPISNYDLQAAEADAHSYPRLIIR